MNLNEGNRLWYWKYNMVEDKVYPRDKILHRYIPNHSYNFTSLTLRDFKQLRIRDDVVGGGEVREVKSENHWSSKCRRFCIWH